MLKTGTLNISANRHAPFGPYVIRLEGLDMTGGSARAQVRLKPDTPGAALIDLSTSGVAGIYDEGIYLTNTVEDGQSIANFSLFIEEATMEALPAAAAVGDNLTLYWDLQITPSGAVAIVLLRGTFTVIAGVTDD
jgi:hypothetical protein